MAVGVAEGFGTAAIEVSKAISSGINYLGYSKKEPVPSSYSYGGSG
jgi:hypothetical protein